MKRIVIPVFLTVFFSILPENTFSADYSVQDTGVYTADILQKYHVRPVKITDDLTIELKNDFIRYLDPAGLFFIQKDIDEFSSYKVNLQTLKNSSWSTFVGKVRDRYKQRLNEVIVHIHSICSKKLHFQTNESLGFHKNSNISYAADSAELKIRWIKYLTFHALLKKYHSIIDSDQKNTFDALSASEEADIRLFIEKTELRKIKAVLQPPDGFDKYMNILFLNVLANHYDPHSMIISSSEMLQFETALSSQSKSFGFSIKRDALGIIRIERIIPGGPLWKTGKASNGDSIVSIISSDLSKTDVTGFSLKEVYSLINGKSDSITLTIKKKNGFTEKCFIRREKMKVEANIVTGYILEGKKKIGYIGLPSFYTDWDSPGSPGCANDVAKEILKLKRDGIEALILDLRDNSGGSMTEAINLAGIFIDEGPMAIVASKDGNLNVIKDPSRGTVYDGPLTLMVNRQSASASEIVAEILKNYNRALIVGSPTFGKATAQIVLPLTKETSHYKTLPLRFPRGTDTIKVTTSIFYNISGVSYQTMGVQPHIMLHEFTDQHSVSERELPYSLTPEAITKTVAIDKLDNIPVERLSKLSSSRRAESIRFKGIIEYNSIIDKEASHSYTISLNIDSFMKEMLSRNTSLSDIEKTIFTPTQLFKTSLSSQDKTLVLIDSYLKEINNEKIQSINEDVFIDEAYSITLDFIN